MGSAESKVAVQPPLAVVVSPGAGSVSPRPVVLCNFLRKQNKTVPVPTTTSPQPTPPSSPTIEAVKEAKKPSAASTADSSAVSGGGPPVQILLTNRALSLHQLGFEELSTQLLKAVKNGDQKLVERIAEISATKQLSVINIRGMWESTPLIYACQYCHEPIALWLLQAAANVHLVNEKGVTALLLASLEGMTAAVQQILLQLTDTTGSDEERIPIDAQVGVVYNSTADLNVRVSPLLGASMNGHVEVVRMLLQHGANVNCGVSTTGAKAAPSGNAGTRGGGEGGNGALQFPLLVAAKYGHNTVVQLLIKSGASIGVTDGNENHALLLACEAAKEDCALTLLRHLPVAEHAAWKRPNCHGFTALHYCAVHGLVKVAVCMLLQLQWRDDLEFLNATSSTRHECAVLMATRKKQIEVVKLLIQCDADATLVDRGGTSALDVLKREKRDEVVSMWQEQQQLRRKEKQGGQEKAGETVAEMKEVCNVQEKVVEENGTPERKKTLEKLFPVELEVAEKGVVEADAIQSQAELRDQVPLPLSETAQTQTRYSPIDPIEEVPCTVLDASGGLVSLKPTAPSLEAASTVTTAETRELQDHILDQQKPSISSPAPVNHALENEPGGDEQEPVSPCDEQGGTISVPRADVIVRNGPNADASTFEAEEATPAALIAPQRPSSSKPKSTSSKKSHNRRGTGHISQDISSAKRLSSRVGTMSAIAMGSEDGEDGADSEEPGEESTKPNLPAVASQQATLPWEDSSLLLNGATTITSTTIESKADDRTASSRVMTFSRGLAPVVAAPTIEGGVDGNVELPDKPASSSSPTMASSSSPRKEQEKHKKKKRHSRKKLAEDEDATPTAEEPFAMSSSPVSKQQPPEVEIQQQRFASVRIQQRDEDDKGALDDDF